MNLRCLLALCLLNFTTERSKDYLYVGTRQGCIDIYDTKQWPSLKNQTYRVSIVLVCDQIEAGSAFSMSDSDTDSCSNSRIHSGPNENLYKTIFRSQKHFPGTAILHMKIYHPSVFNSPASRPKLGRRSTMPSILITPPKKSNSKLFVALQDGKIYWSFIQHLLG